MYKKYDEIMALGVKFMEDNDNVVHDIKSSVTGQPMLVILDDLIGSMSLKTLLISLLSMQDISIYL